MFTFLYDKFTPGDVYQILSQSIRFCRLYIKKHSGVFFWFTVYYSCSHECSVTTVFNFWSSATC